MKGKVTLLTGAAIGYVLGTAAGRQRFEQLKAGAKKAMENPKVQGAAQEVQHKVQGAAQEVQHKVADAASKATHAAADKVRHVPSQSQAMHDSTTHDSTMATPAEATTTAATTPTTAPTTPTGAPLA